MEVKNTVLLDFLVTTLWPVAFEILTCCRGTVALLNPTLDKEQKQNSSVNIFINVQSTAGGDGDEIVAIGELPSVREEILLKIDTSSFRFFFMCASLEKRDKC